MRSKNIPSYLFKSSHDIFYFRVRIPTSIRIQYNTSKKEIRKSLNTRDISIAYKKARYLSVMMEVTDYTMKDMEQNLQDDNYGKKLLKQFLIADMKSNGDDYFRDHDDETPLDCFLTGLSSKENELLAEQVETWNKLSQSTRDEELVKLKNKIEPKLTIAKESLGTSSVSGVRLIGE